MAAGFVVRLLFVPLLKNVGYGRGRLSSPHSKSPGASVSKSDMHQFLIIPYDKVRNAFISLLKVKVYEIFFNKMGECTLSSPFPLASFAV